MAVLISSVFCRARGPSFCVAASAVTSAIWAAATAAAPAHDATPSSHPELRAAAVASRVSMIVSSETVGAGDGPLSTSVGVGLAEGGRV